MAKQHTQQRPIGDYLRQGKKRETFRNIQRCPTYTRAEDITDTNKGVTMIVTATVYEPKQKKLKKTRFEKAELLFIRVGFVLLPLLAALTPLAE